MQEFPVPKIHVFIQATFQLSSSDLSSTLRVWVRVRFDTVWPIVVNTIQYTQQK